MGISILYRYIHMHMCTFSKDIGINMEKEICVLNKEFISGQKHEKTNVAAKCEIFMNCSKNLIGICKKCDCQTRNT